MQADIEFIESQLTEHLSRQPESLILESRKSFLETGFALISYMLPENIKKPLADEIMELVDTRSARRDVRFKETSNSARRMRNVSADEIRGHGGWVETLYESTAFRDALGQVAAEPVLECPYLPEQYIITHLEQAGDTHGWHWDDYRFGVIFVVNCPPVEHGGFVQCVAGTSWDKSDPQVFRKLIENPIRSYELRPGDLYILRTDTTLHQVHPIMAGSRTIVNFAFAAESDLEREISHETMKELFRRTA